MPFTQLPISRIKNNKRFSQSITALTLASYLFCGYSLATDKLDVSGYIMLDHDSFAPAFLENGESSDSLSDIRRARLSFKTDIDKDWRAKFQIGFAGDETEIKDAYLQYSGWSWGNLTIGQQKEAFGLEKLSSSRNLLMIERSMVTEAFAPGRSLGVSLNGEISKVQWQLGYYQPDNDEARSAITGRVTWLPWQNNENLLHLGFAFSERDYDGNEFRINERLEVYSADSLLEGNKLLADNVSLQGLELLWMKDKFTVMGEWQQASVTTLGQENYGYQGGYLQLGYQLSGGQRQYKNGVLGSSAKKGWELTSRYSEFSLDDENIEAKTYAVGLNYSVNKRLKFMTDIIRAEHAENGQKVDSGNALSLRVQYSF
ncbi:MAG: OprO/OprP family phosphate-selective porin [Thalassotalea sp.]